MTIRSDIDLYCPAAIGQTIFYNMTLLYIFFTLLCVSGYKIITQKKGKNKKYAGTVKVL